MDIQFVRSRMSTQLNPEIRNSTKKLAAVLVVIYGDPPKVIMTLKPKDLKVHAGEISFPGGKPEESDADLIDTALRETREEIGLNISRKQVIGQLDSVTTLNSGFEITPFVAVTADVPDLETSREVDKIFRIPLEPFLRTMRPDPDPEHCRVREMHIFSFEEHVVWGASARILRQITMQFRI